MKDVFLWWQVSVDLGFNTDTGETNQPIELDIKVMNALKMGRLTGYDEAGTPISLTAVDHDTFVYPPEVNSWFKDIDFLHRWNPAPQEKRVGRPPDPNAIGKRVKELQKEGDRVRNHNPGITKRQISDHMASKGPFSGFGSATIERLLRFPKK
tara:strand:+ start:850 stop:1308 length:459 start_codon:yes stop_codon:yes gene_type:complete